MIYKLNNKQLSNKIKEFGKTTYGKITFLLSYSVFFITILLFMLINSAVFPVLGFGPSNNQIYRGIDVSSWQRQYKL